MSLFTNFAVFLLIRHALAVSYYCEFGFCEVDQYCCGNNRCCDKLLDLWYFWVGVVIVIVVVATIIFLKFYYYHRRPKSHYGGYNLLKTEIIENRVDK